MELFQEEPYEECAIPLKGLDLFQTPVACKAKGNALHLQSQTDDNSEVITVSEVPSSQLSRRSNRKRKTPAKLKDYVDLTRKKSRKRKAKRGTEEPLGTIEEASLGDKENELDLDEEQDNEENEEQNEENLDEDEELTENKRRLARLCVMKPPKNT